MRRTVATAAHPSARSGFTLTELMIVMVIIGIMVAMGVPSLQQVIEQSRADVAAANLRAIWAAERLFWLENHTYTTLPAQTSPPLGLVAMALLDNLPATADDAASQRSSYYYTATCNSDGSAFTATATNVFDNSIITIDQNGNLTPPAGMTLSFQ